MKAKENDLIKNNTGLAEGHGAIFMIVIIPRTTNCFEKTAVFFLHPLICSRQRHEDCQKIASCLCLNAHLFYDQLSSQCFFLFSFFFNILTRKPVQGSSNSIK